MRMRTLARSSRARARPLDLEPRTSVQRPRANSAVPEKSKERANSPRVVFFAEPAGTGAERRGGARGLQDHADAHRRAVTEHVAELAPGALPDDADDEVARDEQARAERQVLREITADRRQRHRDHRGPERRLRGGEEER